MAPFSLLWYSFEIQIQSKLIVGITDTYLDAMDGHTGLNHHVLTSKMTTKQNLAKFA